MDRKKIKKLNDTLVGLFQDILLIEEEAINSSSDHDLTISEIHTLSEIGIGRAKTMTQVAVGLKISVGALTTAMNKLEKKGYIRRFRVPEDRRIVRVELTESGAEAFAEHEQFHVEMVESILACLTWEQQEVLEQSLKNVEEFCRIKMVKPLRQAEDLQLRPVVIRGRTIPVPVFQGGMCVGMSLSGLASEVAACGGVGTIAAAQIGYREPDYETDPHGANLRVLRREAEAAVSRIRDIPDAGVIAVNVMYSENHYEEMVRAAVDAGAQMIISGAGLPASLPGICRGRDVMLVPVISSVRALSLLRKSWARKHNRVPDAVIFEGAGAGGYLGFKEEQVEHAESRFYEIILEIKKELEDLPGCPLIVGGGIVNRADLEKALAYGADGVLIGTRFLTTEESEAPDAVKAAVLAADQDSLTVIRSPGGMPARVIRNQLADRLARGEVLIRPGQCETCRTPCRIQNPAYCLADVLIAAARGDTQNGLLFCGGGADRIRAILRVADVFREMTEQQ